MMNPIIEYDFNTNCNFPGSLPDGISHLIDNDAQTQMVNNLRCGCGSFLTPHAAHFKMPDFFVNLGLTGKNARNEQKPHIVVPQEMRLKGEQYFLAGAMQMGLTADHFLAIVNHCGAYVVLDDLNNNVMMYPTFAAAVSRQLTDSSVCKELKPHEAGIHILLYMKILHPCPHLRVRSRLQWQYMKPVAVHQCPLMRALVVHQCPLVRALAVIQKFSHSCPHFIVNINYDGKVVSVVGPG